MSSLIVISGPSGAGKTRIIHELSLRLDTHKVVSHTTRNPREIEVDGIDYHFVDPATFESMLVAGGFVEYQVFDRNHYGVSWSALQTSNGIKDRTVLLDLSCSGALEIKKRMPDSLLVFVLPPSYRVARERLATRGMKQDEIERRSLDDDSRPEFIPFYDLIVVNHTDRSHECVSDILDALCHLQRE